MVVVVVFDKVLILIQAPTAVVMPSVELAVTTVIMSTSLVAWAAQTESLLDFIWMPSHSLKLEDVEQMVIGGDLRGVG